MNFTALFAPIERLIEEHGSSTIQGKHIALLREQLSILKEKALESDRENALLTSQLKECEAQVENLRRQLEQAKPTGFVESGGLLWKRKESGAFEPNPYCFECPSHPVMQPFPRKPHSHAWVCPRNHDFDFSIKPPQT